MPFLTVENNQEESEEISIGIDLVKQNTNFFFHLVK
jgi:hypothetical protein